MRGSTAGRWRRGPRSASTTSTGWSAPASANRRRHSGAASFSSALPGASLARIEERGGHRGASIVSHNGYDYLFVSFDLCCKGVGSTYRTMVGRASKITGPYTDKGGVDMMTGAAEQLLASSGRYIGPGGGTAWKDGNTYLYVYHYYDSDNGGAPELQVRPIVFDSSDWVTLGAPLFP